MDVLDEGVRWWGWVLDNALLGNILYGGDWEGGGFLAECDVGSSWGLI